MILKSSIEQHLIFIFEKIRHILNKLA